MKRIVNGISTNSLNIPTHGRYYAVGFRTDCYGTNEWLVRFTSSYDNALAYVENEKAKQLKHDPCTHNLHDEYRIWKCDLNDAKIADPPKPMEIDY